jgi:hypothetical protein
LCGEYSAAYEFNGELLEGELPKSKNKAVRDWCLVKYMELQYAWECTRKKKEVPWIEPN